MNLTTRFSIDAGWANHFCKPLSASSWAWPHSPICLLLCGFACWGNTHTRMCTRDLKKLHFCFYFLFVSCRLFLKKKLLALQITISINFAFFPHKHAHPFLSFIHPSLPHYPVIFDHWHEREKRTGERRRRRRKMANFLLVCLSVHLTINFYSTKYSKNKTELFQWNSIGQKTNTSDMSGLFIKM